MQREIKFRAWEKVKKWEKGVGYTDEYIWRMNYSPSIDGEEIFGGASVADLNTGLMERDTFKLMQYTGLKDKNGVEIYEGDVVQFTEVDEDSAFGAEETNIVEVRWVDEIAQWRAVFKSGRRTELHFVVQLPTVVSCEIIGNIYQNPELLNQKEKTDE